MAGIGNRFWRALRGCSALAIALAYLFASTQIAAPVKAWIEARAAAPVKAEAFACAVHKCQCRNALQCRAHCCCFPKASAFGAKDHGHEDGMGARLTACGGAPDSLGMMPSLPDHAPSASGAVPAAASIAGWMPAGVPDFPSPYPKLILKVPIQLPS
jgi:hypothetical protein